MSEATSVRVFLSDCRQMTGVDDESVHLVVTSPPYWQLKDYGAEGQIGFHQTYEEYTASLNCVWRECHRILHPGCRLCVNIGDQFARSVIYGRYKVIPIREEIIRFCESIGFDYMGAIIWQKQTTMNTTGGATVMGSFPYPRNGIVKIDYEFILLLKKLGNGPKPSKELKEASRLTQGEWETFFAGHWQFGGERQNKHLAMFPLELPRRLIKMFSFVGDTVLDPFIGSGTTAAAGRALGRNAIGFEIDPTCVPVMREKVGEPIEFIGAAPPPSQLQLELGSAPGALARLVDPRQFQFGSVVTREDKGKGREDFYRVTAVTGPNLLELHTGLKVRLLGVSPIDGHADEATGFLKRIALRQRVRLEFDEPKHGPDGTVLAYVYAENKTFVNAKLIREGFARCEGNGKRSAHLRSCEDEARENRKGQWAAFMADDPASNRGAVADA